jgi:hypothetical protein
MRGDVEVRLSHGVNLAHPGGDNWFDAIDRAGNVLRVIEGVVEIGAQLDLPAVFTDGEVLEDRKIQVLDRYRCGLFE